LFLHSTNTYNLVWDGNGADGEVYISIRFATTFVLFLFKR